MAQKMEQDFSSAVEQVIPSFRKKAQEGDLEHAIEGLLVIEKQTRTAGDAISTGKILVSIVELCFEMKDYKALKENVLFLNKRRSQLKSAIKSMVKRCMQFLDSLPYDQKIGLIDALLSITEGKIFVEKQRARLTLILASIRESEGKLVEAANILQEVQVETFGSITKSEKLAFILEQMRLCLLKKDYIRTHIIARKILPNSFADESLQDLKIRYHKLMIQFYEHDFQYLNIYHAYQAIYTTPIIVQDPMEWQRYLKLSVIYLILAPYNLEKNSAMLHLAADKRMAQLPLYAELLNQFLTLELLDYVQWSSQMIPDLKGLPSFQVGSSSQDQARIEQLWADLYNRTTEHNLRVVEHYYSEIEIQHLAQLIHIPVDDCEACIRRLVQSRQIHARINRMQGTVRFIHHEQTTDTLNHWRSQIEQLLSLVDRTCHFIQREYMIHTQQPHTENVGDNEISVAMK